MWLFILRSSSIGATQSDDSSDVLLIVSVAKLNFQQTWNRALNTEIVDLTVMKTYSLISKLSICKYNDEVQAIYRQNTHDKHEWTYTLVDCLNYLMIKGNFHVYMHQLYNFP